MSCSQIGSGGSYFNSQNNATVVPHWWHGVIVNHHVRSHKAHHKSLVISCNKSTLFYWVKQLSLNLPCNLMSPRLISSSRTGYGMRVSRPQGTKESLRIFPFLKNFQGTFYKMQKPILLGGYHLHLFKLLYFPPAFSKPLCSLPGHRSFNTLRPRIFWTKLSSENLAYL